MNNINYLHRNRGFSLIELLIAIALIGIMMAIAVPGILSQRPKWFINGTTREIASKLMAARIKAVQGNDEFVVVFNQGASPNTFTLYQTENYSATGPSFDLLVNVHTNKSDARGGATITGCENIIFLPNGKAEGAVASGSACSEVGHDDIQKFYKKIEYLGSIFPPVYIYITPHTGNIIVSDLPPA